MKMILFTIYTSILAKRKTQNINAKIVGSTYTRITSVTFITSGMILKLNKKRGTPF